MITQSDHPTTEASHLETDSPRAPMGDGPNTRPGGRILGIDIARGIALLGMFTVHVFIFGPNGESPGNVASWLLSAPSGRASVLFFLLSGISLSTISRGGSASASPGVLRRRGSVLLMGGLLLTAGAWSASILEHYGVMFLLAPWFLTRSNRTLHGLTVTGLIGGPIAMLWLPGWSTTVTGVTDGALGWTINTAWSLLVTGTYPLVFWFGFFVLGVRLGRLDMRSTRTAAGLLVAGIAGVLVLAGALNGLDRVGVSAPTSADFFDDAGSFVDAVGDVGGDPGDDSAVFLTEEEFEATFGDGDSFSKDFGAEPADPARLLQTEGHSGQIGWALQSSSIAVAILGACLLLPAAAKQLLWPLSALGSISLTAYLVHVFLVTDAWSALVGEQTISVGQQIGVLIGLEVFFVIVASIIVKLWRTGPAERGLKALTVR